MRKLLGITLGIMTALGGFVDLGQIVFTTQAGAIVWIQAALDDRPWQCGHQARQCKEPSE